MRDLWIVTSGSHSDYQFLCAFTTRELAEAYAERLNRGDYETQKHWRWLTENGHEPTYEEWLARHGADYGTRAERCDLYDALPVVDADAPRAKRPPDHVPLDALEVEDWRDA